MHIAIGWVGPTKGHTRMAARLSLLSVRCFPNQSALLHCGPSIKDSRKQLEHKIDFQEIYSFSLLVDFGSGIRRRSVDLM